MILRMPNPVIGLLRGYASIFFLENPIVGLVFLLGTFWFFNAGLVGLMSAGVAISVARIMKFANWSSGLHVYNSLLVGLSLGFVYKLDWHLVYLVCLSSTLAVFLTVTISETVWRLERLPCLSLPFVIVTFITTLAAKGYGSLNHYLYPQAPQYVVTWELGDHFFRALGTTLFMPHPIPGIVFFLALLWSSRYMTLLAICGYFVGHITHATLLGEAYSHLGVLNEFNYILTAVALGGIFTVPSWQGFALAMFSSALAAMVSAAMQNVMPIFGLSIMPGPFLLVTLTTLAALSKRMAFSAPTLILNSPTLPETSMERVRLAKARAVMAETVPVLLPFLGEWTVYQGFNGAYTHKAPWQHSIDFIVVSEGRSFGNDGQDLDDYFCFGLPVVSPVYGQVVGCADTFRDNSPGEVDIRNNWGNFILICCGGGLHVLLAHLQQGSLSVSEADHVVPGQRLARCGNSGRSPQPHIHLHVQRGYSLGCATVPFHLSSVIIRQAEKSRFHLATIPSESEAIMMAVADEKFVSAMHLPVGRCLLYRFRINGQQWLLRSIVATLTLEGQFRLVADSGASAAFVETASVLAFYDRSGPEDLFLDMWLLSIGLTPLVGGNIQWGDSPSVSLLPLTLLDKLLYLVAAPFFGGVKSSYTRRWDVGESGWVQDGDHECAFSVRKMRLTKTRAVILPDRGCSSMRLEIGETLFEADLQASGLRDDVGIPGVGAGLAC